jgi:hypothetical protein
MRDLLGGEREREERVAGLVRGYWAGSDRVGPVAYLFLFFSVSFSNF